MTSDVDTRDLEEKLPKQQQEMLSAKLTDAASPSATLIVSDPRAAIATPFDSVKSAILNGTAQANLLSELAAQSGANVASEDRAGAGRRPV